MILDNALVLADSKVLTGISASSTSIVSASLVLDFGASGKNAHGDSLGQNLGEGGQLALNIVCEDQDFAGASAVPTFTLLTANDASLSSGAVTLATIVTDETPNDGDTIGRVKLAAGVSKRYVGLKMKAGTAALSAGKITAWIGQMGETPVSPTNLKK